MPIYCSLIAIAAGSFLSFISLRYIEEGKQRYELEINDQVVSLQLIDGRGRPHNKSQIRLSDLISAEYYISKDTAALLLHSQYRKLEIPLWPFGLQAERDIVASIKSHGIKTIAVATPIR